jgi:hypothetical protein
MCVTLRHDFIGAGHFGQNQGQLRIPDNPDHILESAAADKIRNYRRNRPGAFLPACMSTSGRIHGELLRLIFFLSNKQADDYFAALGYQPHTQEFCHRRGVFFQQNPGTIGLACAQAVALRGAPTTARRHVAAPRHPPPRLPTMIMTGMSATSSVCLLLQYLLYMAYDDHDRNVSYIQCVFITVVPIIKVFAWWGEAISGGLTCSTRDDEPRPVWTSLPITH